LGVAATAGGLASAPDAAPLVPLLTAMGRELQTQSAIRDLRSGPQRRAPDPLWAKVAHNPASASLPPDVLALALELSHGPVRLPRSAGDAAPRWLGLPRGLLAAQQDALPLSLAAPPVVLGDVVQVADVTPVLDRVRVGGRPALWLAADGAGDLPNPFALALWDAVERAVPLPGGVHVESLLLDQRPLGTPLVAPPARP